VSDHHSAEEKAEALVTWRSAVTMSVLLAMVTLVGILNAPQAEHPIVHVRIAGLVWALGLLGLLVYERERPKLRVSRIAFAVTPIPLFPTWWLVIGERSLHGLPLEAFVRQQVACMAYAMATPPAAATSLAMIGAFTVDSLILLWWVGPHAHIVQGQPWQPWTIILYGSGAAVLALYRAHRQRQEVAAIVELERAAAFQRLMRTYLAVRDLVNTPLQTLRISAALLAKRCPGASELAATMERSVDRLDALNRILSADASTVEWPPGGESFDPMTLLRTSSPKQRS
jgi:hypothetical protein